MVQSDLKKVWLFPSLQFPVFFAQRAANQERLVERTGRFRNHQPALPTNLNIAVSGYQGYPGTLSYNSCRVGDAPYGISVYATAKKKGKQCGGASQYQCASRRAVQGTRRRPYLGVL
eukprot:2980059-Rhodomonas_salina.1